MAIQRCPYCKSIIDDKDEYCLNCGTKLIVEDGIFKEDISEGEASVKEEEESGVELEPDLEESSSPPEKVAARSQARSSKRERKAKSEKGEKEISLRRKRAKKDEPREEDEPQEEKELGEEREDVVSIKDETGVIEEQVEEELLLGEENGEEQGEEEEISTEELLEHLEPMEEEKLLPDEEKVKFQEEQEEQLEGVELEEESEKEEEVLLEEGKGEREEELEEDIEKKESPESEAVEEETTETLPEEKSRLFEEETLIFPPESTSPPGFKTEDLEKLVDPAEKEKEEIERFLEALKKEREEKRKKAEKTTGLPPWTSSLKEREPGKDLSVEERTKIPFEPSPGEDETEVSLESPLEEEKVEDQEKIISKETAAEKFEEKALFPLEQEETTSETVGFPETVNQTDFSFPSYEERKPSGISFPRTGPFLSWLKALAFDLLFIAFFWVVAILVTASILKVNIISLVTATPWKMVALYLIFLGVYFFLFFTFIGETLGRQLFPADEE